MPQFYFRPFCPPCKRANLRLHGRISISQIIPLKTIVSGRIQDGVKLSASVEGQKLHQGKITLCTVLIIKCFRYTIWLQKSVAENQFIFSKPRNKVSLQQLYTTQQQQQQKWCMSSTLHEISMIGAMIMDLDLYASNDASFSGLNWQLTDNSVPWFSVTFRHHH